MSNTWKDWSEAFSIFAEFSDEDSKYDNVSAEHDVVYAGPSPDVMIDYPNKLKRLEELGWHTSSYDCFMKYV